MEEDIVILTTLPFTRAMLLKGRLEAEEIQCFLSNINLIQPTVSTGVKIFVKKDDLTRALKILNAIEKKYSKEKIKELTKKEEINVRKILVPVDFSPYSFKAANFALLLAEKLNAEVHLLHAYYNPVVNISPFFDVYSYQANIDNIVETIELQSKIQLKEFKKNILTELKKPNIIVNESLVFGMPTETILYMASDYKPDLIIMGTKGKGDRADDIIGTVSQKVIEKSEVPVLVIPEKFEIFDINDMKNILYVTNFDDSDYRAIWKLVGLISSFNLKLHCLHVGTSDELPWNKSKMEILLAHIKHNFHNIKITSTIKNNKDKAIAIQEYINSKNIDILSLSTHKKSILLEIFYPNLFKKMLFQTKIPVLVFSSNKKKL
ncbi:MAG TPA: universal stress protein [Bacteroidales bacterium]|nr:universal stress protein [Bacteroidales bacterium]